MRQHALLIWWHLANANELDFVICSRSFYVILQRYQQRSDELSLKKYSSFNFLYHCYSRNANKQHIIWRYTLKQGFIWKQNIYIPHACYINNISHLYWLNITWLFLERTMHIILGGGNWQIARTSPSMEKMSHRIADNMSLCLLLRIAARVVKTYMWQGSHTD